MKTIGANNIKLLCPQLAKKNSQRSMALILSDYIIGVLRNVRCLVPKELIRK